LVIKSIFKILRKKKSETQKDEGKVVYKEPDGLGKVLEIKVY